VTLAGALGDGTPLPQAPGGVGRGRSRPGGGFYPPTLATLSLHDDSASSCTAYDANSFYSQDVSHFESMSQDGSTHSYTYSAASRRTQDTFRSQDTFKTDRK
jgi:hypothetical protein